MKYFSVNELCKSVKASNLGIPNLPNKEESCNIVALIEFCLDPCREEFHRPITVTSGFRCAQLNAKVGGETHSQHRKGQAADIVSIKEGRQGNYLIGKILARQGNFDQLIFEEVGSHDMLPGWIHVSYRHDGMNRGEILKTIKGRKGYIPVTKKEIGL